MTDKKEEKPKADAEPVVEKKPDDKFFGKTYSLSYNYRAEKEPSSSGESIPGQRFQNHSFTNQEPEEIEEDV